MKRSASAEWNGGLKDGKGSITTDSGVLSGTRYGFTTRFGEEKGTNPEELIAAAHAGCFSMALSGKLAEASLTAERIATKAEVSLEKLDAGWTVTAVHLTVKAKIPGASAEAFKAAAEKAEKGCPISRLLGAAAKITMDAALEP
ncbi:MAG: OsmC family protein [Elusimicrobiota bacterium]|nr:MAG: OsmC family protein [Elusimicrobiota bacterium]